MANEEIVAQIEQNTSLAIRAMNNDISFFAMKVYLDNAFALCSPKNDLGYYNIIASVFNNLHFRTKTLFGTQKVQKQYLLMYEYLDDKFSNIVNYNVNPQDEEEANLANSICCDIYNGLYRYYNAFSEGIMGGFSAFGLLGIGISYAVTKKKFLKYIKSFACNAAYMLKKYHTANQQILDNISVLDSEQ